MHPRCWLPRRSRWLEHNHSRDPFNFSPSCAARLPGGATPVTMNLPPYMIYAPGVKDADIGGHGFDKEHPFAVNMSSGRDDYIILLVGESEKAKILEDGKVLLKDLCADRNYLCTNSATRTRTPVDKVP